MAYNPSLGIPINKSLSPAQSVPTDGRSYFYDEVLFKWRPYQSTSEVLSYLNLQKFRIGHFSIFINSTGVLNPDGTFTGGNVEEYWFKNDLSTLVLKQNSSSSKFTELTDTFDYTTNTHKLPLVNNGETALVPVEVIGDEGILVEIDDSKIQIETVFTSNLDDSLATVAVGGLPVSTIGNLKDQSLRKIIEDMIAPTLNPSLINPSNGFSKVSPSSNIYEVGSLQNITFNSTFNRGSILPQYSAASPYRSGLPNTYNYSGGGLPATVSSNSLSDPQTITDYVIVAGSNTWTSSVSYDIGVQPYNNKGDIFSTPLLAGTTANQTVSVTGIYPYFYYKSNSPISSTDMQTAIANGDAIKVIGVHTGTITIPFNTSGEYLAVAYPATSTTKTKWYVNALDNGTIPGGVFGGQTTLPCDSPTALWTNVNYKIHVSPGLITQTNPIELRNS